MNSKLLAVAVIIVSVSLGSGLYMVELEDVKGFYSDMQQEPGEEKPVEDDQNFNLGSAHEHALFHIVVNGSEKDLTSSEYQFNARHVHLEGNRSDIVHKHAEGVTWKNFLDTINTSIEPGKNSTEICLTMMNQTSCGEGAVYLNNEPVTGFKTEISQDDNLLIILETEEWQRLAAEYMQKELPEAYREQQRGYRV